jgi:Rrf2 family protein
MAFYGAAVEYALHTLLNLAAAPAGTAPSARDLAEFQRLPLAYVRKLLTRLEKAGLVAATEGRRGGEVRLARDPARITTLDVAEAAEERTALFECREIRARCALWTDSARPRAATAGVCEIHAVMLKAESSMRRALAGTSLADILRRVEAKRSAAAAAAIPAWFEGRSAARRAS